MQPLPPPVDTSNESVTLCLLDFVVHNFVNTYEQKRILVD